MLRIQECHKQYTLTFRKLRVRVRRGVDTLKFPLLLYKKALDKSLCPKVSSHETTTTTKSDLISALVTSNSRYYRLSLCAIQILIRSGNQQQQYTCDMYPISDLGNKCVHLLSLADWYHPFLLLSEILTKSTSQIVRVRAGRWRDVSTCRRHGNGVTTAGPGARRPRDARKSPTAVISGAETSTAERRPRDNAVKQDFVLE